MTDREGTIPLFMADHMLIKLGKYLRILGYDAAWDLACRTHDLIRRANRENRIFLTRNTKLGEEYPVPRRALMIFHEDPVAQFAAVVEKLGLDTRTRLFSRCVLCNVELDPVPDKTAVREKVHPNVYQRYDAFYTCPACGTVFWKGSHVRNTCRKLGLAPPAS
ncbi:MAG: Mut7-C RNAse domain-containing protein [Kiritimatiellae bacterium]|nr:Mut7-C RNAse domain-containing protein [Kiritimatiellia bacterium]